MGDMADAEPDIDALFAPLPPAQASGVVLNEAREVLSQVRQPIEAELWGSDMVGALSGKRAEQNTDQSIDSDGTGVLAELAASLVPAAEKEATTEALGLLRILGALAEQPLGDAASEAADRVSAAGVKDPAWVSGLGSPTVGRCWRYSDIGGRQESVTVSFGYGATEHALSVLIDHGKGGKVKDAWVDNAEGLLDKTWLAAQHDPLIVFENIESADAGKRLANAIAAGECPSKPDEADDLKAHRALLHARVRYLTAH
jgi:hypothetical protein